MKISDLPDDLEFEILSRVPAKALVKLQTSCKRWHALFRDQAFVEKNKKWGKAELMLLSDLSVYSIGNDLHGLHKNSSVELTSLKDPEDMKIFKIFHCDSLILCSTEGNTRLVIWNPFTGQTRQIKPRTCYRWRDTFALGYVVNRKSPSSFSHNYKILRCAYYENDQDVTIPVFEMYELSSDSWRVLDYSTRDYDISSNGVSLKGSTYWVARDKEMGFFMLKFDFTTERFVSLPLPLPFQSSDPLDSVALSVSWDEKLSVLYQGFESSNVMRIWVTNKIDEGANDLSWRSDFVLAVEFDLFCLRNMVDVKSFLLDEENKVAVCCDAHWFKDEYRTRVYSVGQYLYKEVQKETAEASHLNWPLVLTYVPSLVHIQKDTSRRHPER